MEYTDYFEIEKPKEQARVPLGEKKRRVGCYTVNLCANLLIRRGVQEALRDVINQGVPIAVLRQKGYHLADYLLTWTDILAEEEFEGSVYSRSYAEATRRLDERLKRIRIDA